MAFRKLECGGGGSGGDSGGGGGGGGIIAVPYLASHASSLS